MSDFMNPEAVANSIENAGIAKSLGVTPCGCAVVKIHCNGNRMLLTPNDMWPGVTNCGMQAVGCKRVGCPAVIDQEWAATKDAEDAAYAAAAQD